MQNDLFAIPEYSTYDNTQHIEYAQDLLMCQNENDSANDKNRQYLRTALKWKHFLDTHYLQKHYWWERNGKGIASERNDDRIIKLKPMYMRAEVLNPTPISWHW